jgi:hypothetical protein
MISACIAAWPRSLTRREFSIKFRNEFGHMPVSIEEKIPWQCRRLIIGTGTGAMPLMDDVKSEARRRKVALLVLPTTDAIAGAEKAARRNERNLARDVLTAERSQAMRGRFLTSCSMAEE